MSIRLPLATAALLALTPVSAIAAPANTTAFEAAVPHDDLDLTTREGVARLDDRVRTRVRQLCANGGRDSTSQRLERECQIGALAQAETQVRLAIAEANANRPRLAASTPTAHSADTPGA